MRIQHQHSISGFEADKLQLPKICFLFMCADGVISPAETKYLDNIIEKEELSETGIQEFRDFCERMTSKLLTKNLTTVFVEIDNVLGQNEYGYNSLSKNLSLLSGDSNNIDRNKIKQMQTIWTLINLGYADGEYCNAEKEVVNYLVDKWKMNPLLVAELNDTAETILSLTKHKEWLQTTSRPYKGIEESIYEIDRNIKSMFDNVELSISEADIG